MRKRGWKLLIEPQARVFCQPNTPPKSLRNHTWKELYQTLWANRGKLQNLRVQFRLLWVGAPTKAHAVAAFTVYVGRLGLQSTRLWREKPDKEKSLAEDYA
jgi:hypothetical protein